MTIKMTRGSHSCHYGIKQSDNEVVGEFQTGRYGFWWGRGSVARGLLGDRGNERRALGHRQSKFDLLGMCLDSSSSALVRVDREHGDIRHRPCMPVSCQPRTTTGTAPAHRPSLDKTRPRGASPQPNLICLEAQQVIGVWT